LSARSVYLLPTRGLITHSRSKSKASVHLLSKRWYFNSSKAYQAIGMTPQEIYGDLLKTGKLIFRLLVKPIPMIAGRMSRLSILA
jgi:hypothetical protein